MTGHRSVVFLLTYTRRDVGGQLMASRTFTAVTSLRVQAHASSAQQRISLTLVDICNTEMTPVEDVGGVLPQTPMTWAAHSAPSCCQSWLLVAHRLPSWRTATHLAQKWLGGEKLYPLPCWGQLIAELIREYKISAPWPGVGTTLGRCSHSKALMGSG